MKYRKPEVLAIVEATQAIAGMKIPVVADNSHPTTPPESSGAYRSDE
jgi:hypothetical protein